MVFNVLKSSGDQMPDIVRGWDVIVGDLGKKPPALRDPERGIDDCFGRKSMNFAILDAEDVAPQKERTDLPTTIRQELVCLNCALLYLIHVIRRFCFSKNFRTSRIPMLAPQSILAI